MLAHELRNPPSRSTNALHLLGAATSTRTLLAMASRQDHQSRRLVDDLLDVSRITQGSHAAPR